MPIPIDKNGFPIPAMGFASGGGHAIAITDTTARNARPFLKDTQIVSIYADQPFYFKQGDKTVEATSDDHYFPAGIYYDICVGNFDNIANTQDDKVAQKTHIAVLKAGATNGTLWISEKE